MYVVSVDPGEKHFSWCAILNHRILAWDMQACDSPSATAFRKNIEPEFGAHVAACDQVIIEQQPPRNYRMLRQMFYVEMYCASVNPKTCIVHATAKQGYIKAVLPGYKTPKDYRSRKKLSIETVQHLLDHDMIDVATPDNPFLDSSKKDDLADCLIQGLAYVRI